MPPHESTTRRLLIDPAIAARGWTGDLVKAEETAPAIEIRDGKPVRQARGRTDYTLRIKPRPDAQPLAVAIIEAKPANQSPYHGLEQAKRYCDLFHVPFVFSTNGQQFVEYDDTIGLTGDAQPIAAFPTPDDLLARYQQARAIDLGAPAAAPLLQPYTGGEKRRRYYQDAAIRATLEKIARGEKRALLSLATGAGKTFIAVNLLKRAADAGQLTRALFLCDRDELRTQGWGAFHAVFGNDAAEVHRDAQGGNVAKNARVQIATYQTLGIDRDGADTSFLLANFPQNHFTHIIIDECHRSAWGRWRIILDRNPDAVQIGLTATPRQLKLKADTAEAKADERLHADNIAHFGEPVYVYDMSQGMKDGYLAACEVTHRDIFLERKPNPEDETGFGGDDFAGKRIIDANTGEIIEADGEEAHYTAHSFERTIILPDRVEAMCADLFAELCGTGTPEQKTIIFCASDDHADRVAAAMGNLYADWCQSQAKGRKPLQHYAFKCTAQSVGSVCVKDLRGQSRSHLIATTVDLLSTGVDVPCVRNIVFFRYLRSPIACSQMVGRGTRIHVDSGKLMFRVYDYTDATDLLSEDFITAPPSEHKPEEHETEGEGRARMLAVEGIEVRVTAQGRSIVTEVDGKTALVTVDEYKRMLANSLRQQAPTLDDFRTRWISPDDRRNMLEGLPEAGRAAHLVRTVDGMADYDLYDVLAALGYGLSPRTRPGRADAFGSQYGDWLRSLPMETQAVLRAVVAQFVRGGTEALESDHLFQTDDLQRAGGVAALRQAGDPGEVLRQTKQRVFSA